jgi:hypothetical protein
VQKQSAALLSASLDITSAVCTSRGSIVDDAAGIMELTASLLCSLPPAFAVQQRSQALSSGIDSASPTTKKVLISWLPVYLASIGSAAEQHAVQFLVQLTCVA